MKILTDKTMFNDNGDFVVVQQLEEGEISLGINFIPNEDGGAEMILHHDEALALIEILKELTA